MVSTLRSATRRSDGTAPSSQTIATTSTPSGKCAAAERSCVAVAVEPQSRKAMEMPAASSLATWASSGSRSADSAISTPARSSSSLPRPTVLSRRALNSTRLAKSGVSALATTETVRESSIARTPSEPVALTASSNSSSVA
jgi:hypothetical protein